jgi:hypothetical protein
MFRAGQWPSIWGLALLVPARLRRSNQEESSFVRIRVSSSSQILLTPVGRRRHDRQSTRPERGWVRVRGELDKEPFGRCDGVGDGPGLGTDLSGASVRLGVGCGDHRGWHDE